MEKVKLSDITLSISKQRNKDLDGLYEIKSISLNEYDIRVDRNVNDKTESLRLNGQAKPITINIREDGNTVVVDGRTRFLGMQELRSVMIDCEVYVGMNELEENYWNAVLNSQVAPLTSDEKLEFVKKYKDVLDPSALGKALRLSIAQVKDYIRASNLDDDTIDLFRQQEAGYGRGSFKIEVIGDITKRVDDEEAIRHIAVHHIKSKLTDRRARTWRKRVADTTNRYMSDETITSKYTTGEIVDRAVDFVKNTKNSGNLLPKNSEEKYPIIHNIIKDKSYDFLTILFSEGLYRNVRDGNIYDSETKMFIDHGIDNVIVNTIDLEKIEEVKSYMDKKNVKYVACNENALDTIKELDRNKGNGLVFINGAFLWSQRPELLNVISRIYPNSTIIMVYIDFIFGSSQLSNTVKDTELITVFGLRNPTMTDVKMRFNELTYRNVDFMKYADLPQEKYLVVVK